MPDFTPKDRPAEASQPLDRLHCGTEPGSVESSSASMPQAAPTLESMRLLRLADVLKLIPFKRAYWQRGVQQGRFPKPLHCGRVSYWRVQDLMPVLIELNAGTMPPLDQPEKGGEHE